MPSRHSKNNSDRGHFTYHEKKKAGHGTVKQRLSGDSQLPFGYCSLSLQAAEDPVVSPFSGRIYSKAAILEYLLVRMKEIKRTQELYEAQQRKLQEEENRKLEAQRQLALQSFSSQYDAPTASVSGVNSELISNPNTNNGKRKVDEILLLEDAKTTEATSNTSLSLTLYAGERSHQESGHSSNFSTSSSKTPQTSINSEYQHKRSKVLDETSKDEQVEQLRKVSPWIPQFTPDAGSSSSNILPPPSKRPLSPFSQRPIRSKDFIPINLIRESESSDAEQEDIQINKNIRYVCPVSRKTITNQKIVLLKNTGAYMIEEVYKTLALPNKLCPLTNKKFHPEEDVLIMKNAVSGYAATGDDEVVAVRHRPTIN